MWPREMACYCCRRGKRSAVEVIVVVAVAKPHLLCQRTHVRSALLLGGLDFYYSAKKLGLLELRTVLGLALDHKKGFFGVMYLNQYLGHTRACALVVTRRSTGD